MALQSSGQISMNQMHIEAGGTSGTQCSMNDADMRSLAGISSGQIGANNFYGKSATLDVSINVTVGNNGLTYAYRGVAISSSNINNAPWGTAPSDFGTKGAYLPDVSLRGINYQSYPAAGTPSIRIEYLNTDDAPGDIDNLYMTVTDGTNTTGDFPVGLNGEAAYQQSYSARNTTNAMTVTTITTGSYPNLVNSNTNQLNINYAELSSATAPPEWNGVSTSNGASWTVNFFEN